MKYRAALIEIATAITICASAGAAFAQGCVARTGEASAPTRVGALTQAFETMLRSTDAAVVQRWIASGRKVGEAPGYTIVKMTSTCSPARSGFTCRIEATLCKH